MGGNDIDPEKSRLNFSLEQLDIENAFLSEAEKQLLEKSRQTRARSRRELGSPIKGTPELSDSRGDTQVSSPKVPTQERRVQFADNKIPIDKGLSHNKKNRRKRKKIKYNPANLRRSTRNSRQNAVQGRKSIVTSARPKVYETSG